jgi:hypothetical protein
MTFIVMALLNFAVLPFLPMIFGKCVKKLRQPSKILRFIENF